jgi:signal transduction histidine kinase/CheY-like chemotaxis protein
MPDSPSPLSFKISAEAGARGVIVTDIEHKIAYIDSRICVLLGVEGSELIGGEIGQVVHNVLKNRFKDADEYEKRSVWLMANPTETAEDVMELAPPEHRVLHRYSTPLLDDKGRSTGRIEVYSDITKRRHLEESNVTLYKQMCAAYDELRAAQDQLVLSEKLRAIGEIASGVAHDFNNTLGIILGNIQLLLRKAEDEKTRARLHAVEQAALDGAETVRRIREFTKIQPDEPLSLVNLSTLVTAVVDVMRPSWESSMHATGRRIDVEFQLADEVLASGIAAEIREVLTNILLNAVQAMPNGGKIFVSTRRANGYASIDVRDTGTGMTDDVRKRIFDPFFTTKGVEGTGLGMSVAYGIVKRHNGQITIESIPDEGTTISISLPAAAPGSEVAGAEKLQRGRDSVEPVRILVVDDEEPLAQVFVDMLSEDGHIVCVAGSGRDAIDQFKKKPFDLVFTDLGMPEMSGWQVARGIKDIEPSTPVVLVTGWGTKVDENQLAESEIDMVLSKPVKIEDLSGAVSQVLAQKRRD